MAKTFKILGIILLTIIVLIGIGIFLLIHYVDPNKFKGQIGAAVYSNTGHQLTINGNLSWSFFPWVGFKVTDAELNSAPGFGKQPLAKIGEADISIRLLPLLSGHVEVRNVELNSLQMNLIRNAAGANNWQTVDNDKTTNTPANTTKTAPTNETHAKCNSTLDFSIANLTVVNSNIKWNDQLNKQSYHVSNLYINGHNVGTQKLFPLTISFNLTSNKFTKPIAMSFSGNFNIDDQLDSVAINQINANINNFELEANLSAKNLKGRANFQGDVHISTFNLRQLLTNFNITLPKLKEADALQKISADIAFNGGNNVLSIKPLKLVIDNTTINGNVDFANIKAHQVTFKLNADTVNVDNYMPVKTNNKTSSKTASATASTTSSSTSPAGTQTKQTKIDQQIDLPIKLLRNLNLQGSIGINQFVIANLHMSNVQANASANNGLIKISPFTASLYEGNINNDATLNVRNAVPNYQLTTTVKAIQAQPLLNDLLNKNFISGTANFSAKLNTNGSSVNTLISHLDGNSQFTFNNGQISGVNINYELARAAALLDRKSPPAKAKTNTTPFGTTTGTINLNNGIATNNDLQMDNKHFVGKGRCTVNLNMQNINYKLAIMPTGGTLKTYSIPLTITGSLSSPNVQLDTNDILKQVLNKQKQRLIKQQKQRVKSQAQQQINKYIKHKDLQQALGKLLG